MIDSLADRAAQLLDELAHADRLIDRLVAENEQLRARMEQQDRVIAALRTRSRGLSAVGGGCTQGVGR